MTWGLHVVFLIDGHTLIADAFQWWSIVKNWVKFGFAVPYVILQNFWCTCVTSVWRNSLFFSLHDILNPTGRGKEWFSLNFPLLPLSQMWLISWFCAKCTIWRWVVSGKSVIDFVASSTMLGGRVRLSRKSLTNRNSPIACFSASQSGTHIHCA